MKTKYFIIIFILLAGASYWLIQARWPDKAAAVTQTDLSQAATGSLGVMTDIPDSTSTDQTLNASEATTSPSRTGITTYVIQAGDTISTIAEKFNISSKTILLANNLSATSLLNLNDKLTILPINGVLYKVRSGDSFSKIATMYGTTSDKILAANQLTEASSLIIGQLLLIPDGEKANLEASQPASAPKTASITKTVAKQPAPVSTKSGSVVWASSGLRELNKIPAFVRPSVKAKVTNYAISHGIKVITVDVYKKIKV